MTNVLNIDTGVTVLSTAAVPISMGPAPVMLGGPGQLAMTLWSRAVGMERWREREMIHTVVKKKAT